ncbi:MAG TPA: DEAD/DEAH box helicase [Myxococcota bacterium]|nr:DEAD/DEAH box helicase [Myxococcota bacterium]HPC92611.1 DEAD/DEAH box helicase [Myxococcota bacterium]HPL25820.1 DEAD/DEAH box helicase [Myxococcota bacterium]HQE72868.1 DEAD/DEAH box helicase [Myxococcota bacterium]HQI62088.1 DEAD/DEAH box helicase [Myxococcota bacterium]
MNFGAILPLFYAPKSYIVFAVFADAGPDISGSFPTFDALGLSEHVLRAIMEIGYKKPLQVQVECFAPAKAGRNLVVQSRTGSGKTAAFALPILHRIDYSNSSPQVVVVVPTRELALQVHGEFERLGRYTGLKSVCIYGGTGFGEQFNRLMAGVHVIVGTPGRLLDHYRRGNFRTDQVHAIVLDEADEMLSAGFYDDIQKIFELLSNLKQVLLFSATMPFNMENLIKRYMKDPVRIDLSKDQVCVDRITNVAYSVDTSGPRIRTLIAIIEAEDPTAAIIFCNTRQETEVVAKYLGRRGYDAQYLNSDLSQTAREAVMAKIKAGELRLLVATDIAARGIDISFLPCVIHFDLPTDPQQYIHRTGRTGRVGRPGRAIAMVSVKDLHSLRRIESTLGIKLKQAETPTREESLKMLADRKIREFKERLDAKPAIPEEFTTLAKEILADPDAEGLVSLLVDAYMSPPPAAVDDRAPDRRESELARSDGRGTRGFRPPRRR